MKKLTFANERKLDEERRKAEEERNYSGGVKKRLKQVEAEVSELLGKVTPPSPLHRPKPPLVRLGALNRVSALRASSRTPRLN